MQSVMVDGETTRRDVLSTIGVIGHGTLWRRSHTGSTLSVQTSGPVTIDRTVDDLVVLPAAQNATVTGTATLDPGTDFIVRVTSRDDPRFVKSAGAVVSDDGTWSATFDLSEAIDGQTFTIAVIFNGDRVATASGRIGPLTASFSFSDQTAEDDGTVVIIGEARLEVGGFIAIHEETPTGPIIGVSEYLTGGVIYADLAIRLDSSVTGETLLVATAHLDTNGDQTFDFIENPSLDQPYEENGDPVSDEAIVTGTTPVTPTVSPSPPEPTTAPPPTIRRQPTPEPPPPSGSGIDVVIAGTGGFLGVWVLRKANARLRRGDDDGNDGDEENRQPTAQIVYAPENPEPGRPVLFDGTLSFDPDPGDHIVGYDWTIGDTDTTGQRVVHVFGQTGEVDVELVVTDTQGETGTQTKTVAVEVTEGKLELEAAHPDASGTERTNLRDEYVTFTNAGDAALDLDGWTIHDAAEEEDRVREGDHTFTIPEGVVLDPEATLTVHTGSAPDADEFEEGATDRHLYWGKRRPIWNNDADIIVVSDDADHPVLATRYERTETGEYEFEPLDAGGLGDWFPPVAVNTRGRTPFLNVSIDPQMGLTAISNAIEFIAGALFLRGPKEFVDSWALITGFLLVSLMTWILSTTIGMLEPSIEAIGPILLLLGALSMTIFGGTIVLLQRAIEFLVDSVT